MWKAKFVAPVIAVLLFAGAVVPAQAASLTESQIQSILGLLSSFGAEQRVINNVNASLRGQATTGTTAPASASPICSYISGLSQTLYEGISDSTTGGQVTMLQRFLAGDSSVYPEGSITGYFGPATERAVQRWQAQNGVVSSGSPETNGHGVVGFLTRTAFAKRCGYATPSQPSTNTQPTPTKPINPPTTYTPPANTTVNFSATPLFGSIPLHVGFTAENFQGDNGQLRVDFGDGSSCSGYGSCTWALPYGYSGPYTSHTYSTSGVYTAKLLLGTQVLDTVTINVNSVTTNALPSIKIVYPNGGEKFKKGQAYTLTWNAYNLPTNTVDLYVISSDGTVQGDIAKGVANTGNYTWTIPASQLEGAHRFYVSSGAISDHSDNIFEIWDSSHPIWGSAAPSLSASPASGALTGASPTLWVDFVVNNYTPNGTELVDFGDGTKSALGYTTAYNSRHDYHSAGVYTVKVLSGSTVIATTQVTVSVSSIPMANNTQLMVTVPSPVTIGSAYIISWKDLSGPTIAQLVNAFPNVYGELIAYPKGHSSINPTPGPVVIASNLSSGTLLAGQTSWNVTATAPQNGLPVSPGSFSVQLVMNVPVSATQSNAVAQGNSGSFTLCAANSGSACVNQY